jgi:hypothetical protein
VSSRRPPVHSFSLSLPHSGRLQHLRSCRPSGICLIFFLLVVGSADAAKLPEYSAAEAKKHIGETARVTHRVGCVAANRHGGFNIGLGDCAAQTPFWVVTHGDISGPKLDISELKGVVVTVTGKIDNEPGVPRIFVKSTSQIVPHRP